MMILSKQATTSSQDRLSKRLPKAPIVLSLACLMLTGCNQARFPDFTTTGSVFGTSKESAYSHALAERRPVQEAMVELPLRAGAPLEVIQSRAGNGIKQRIVLKGDALATGQNTVDVRMVVKKVWPKPRKEGIGTHGSSLGAIKAQMRRALPGIKMRMSNELNTNAYGPFGYALGRAPGNVRCLFGWQNVSGKGREPLGIFTKASQRPELSVRVRICRGDVNSEQLVAMLRRMRFDADPNRVTKPQAVSWRAGNGEDIQSFAGSSSQGYLSQKPKVSYQPEGLTQQTKPAAVAKASARKNRVARKKTATRKTSPAVLPTTVASTPNVLLPTPSKVDVVGAVIAGSTQTPKLAAVPIIQPKTSLITLPGESSAKQAKAVNSVSPVLTTVGVEKSQETAVIYKSPVQSAPAAKPRAPKGEKIVLPLPD